jgi:uncharacterized repeat protein (TIGR02543 family)
MKQRKVFFPILIIGLLLFTLMACDTGTSTDTSTSTAKTYSVTYDGNGKTSGTVPTDSTNYASGDTITLKTNSGSLAKTGYTFSGWNTDSSGSGTHYDVSATVTMASANLTFYAEWTEAITVPAAPTGLTATVKSANAITVSWNEVSGATSYNLYKFSGTATSAGYVKQGSYTTTQNTFSGLTASTVYGFRVTAVNSAGEGEASSNVTATTSTVVVQTGAIIFWFNSSYDGDTLRSINFYSSGNSSTADYCYTPTSGAYWSIGDYISCTDIPIGKYEIEIVVRNGRTNYYYYTSGSSSSMTWSVPITAGCSLKYKYVKTKVMPY